MISAYKNKKLFGGEADEKRQPPRSVADRKAGSSRAEPSNKKDGRTWIVALCICLGTVAALVSCGSKTSNKPPLEPSNETTSDTDDSGTLAGFSPEGDGGAGGEPGGGAAILQGNADGAKALLTQFVSPTADHVALTRSLRPTTSDYKSLFDPATAGKIEAAHAKDWDSGKAVIKPGAGQTEIKIWSATGADLATGKGDAKEFPGGYKKVAKHLVPTQLFFRFKFVEAGKDKGTGYDGLAFVNGHWVLAPKPWKAVEGNGSVSGDDDSGGAGGGAAADPPAKPAGKPKGKPKGKKK